MVMGTMADHPSHIVDIPPDAWNDSLERLSQDHLNRIVSVEVYEPQAERRQFLDLPLEGIAVTLDGNQEVISIVARDEVRTHVVHVTKAPLHLRVETGPDGITRTLEIESENGGCTIVHFRTEQVPETVQAQTL
jgi:hypothetical protein